MFIELEQTSQIHRYQNAIKLHIPAIACQARWKRQLTLIYAHQRTLKLKTLEMKINKTKLLLTLDNPQHFRRCAQLVQQDRYSLEFIYNNDSIIMTCVQRAHVTERTGILA